LEFICGLFRSGSEEEEGGGCDGEQREDGDYPPAHQRSLPPLARASVTNAYAGRPASSAGCSSRETSRHSAGSGTSITASPRGSSATSVSSMRSASGRKRR